MEPDFDKEIDALLRKETVGRTITISEFGGIHLDADEITAFAEKKVPPGVRDSFIEHFAACDRCRKVLLNAEWLNAEEEPARQPGIIAPAGIAVPWYRRLLLFPNLAYVMGSLVVLFAGFIGLSVVYNSFGGRSTQVSQVEEFEQTPAASGPSAADETDYAANSNASMSTAANSNYNTSTNMSTTTANANAAPYSANRALPQPSTGETSAAPISPRDEALKQPPETVVTAAPPPPAKSDVSPAGNASTQRLMQDRRASGSEKEEKLRVMRSEPVATPTPRAKRAAGNEITDAQTAEADLSLRKAKPAAPTGGAASTPNRKQVGGRTFEQRQGTWFDTGYRGQGTINVRRNSDSYRRLDRGLRAIAESLNGTVVAVWNGKAYRIQ